MEKKCDVQLAACLVTLSLQESMAAVQFASQKDLNMHHQSLAIPHAWNTPLILTPLANFRN